MQIKSIVLRLVDEKGKLHMPSKELEELALKFVRANAEEELWE